jgi:hypothetical protein
MGRGARAVTYRVMLTKIGHRVVLVPVFGITILLGYAIAMALLSRSETLSAHSVKISAIVIAVLALLDLSRIKWFTASNSVLSYRSLFFSGEIPLADLQFRLLKDPMSYSADIYSFIGKGITILDHKIVQLQISEHRWWTLAMVSARGGEGLTRWRGEFLQLLDLGDHPVHAKTVQSFQDKEQLRRTRAYRSLSWALVVALCGLAVMYYFPDETMRALSKITQWLPDRPHRGGVQYYDIPQ